MRYRADLNFRQDLIGLQVHGTTEKTLVSLTDADDPFMLVQHYEDVVQCHIDDLGEVYRAWGKIRTTDTKIAFRFIGWDTGSGSPFIAEELTGGSINIRHLVEHGELFPRPFLYRLVQLLGFRGF